MDLSVNLSNGSRSLSASHSFFMSLPFRFEKKKWGNFKITRHKWSLHDPLPLLFKFYLIGQKHGH